ncbi:MAG TPA: protein kinase [Candidatus Acidoferrum sp.]|nr:protein kinase [Candidatus Acidoferrum sp.]
MSDYTVGQHLGDYEILGVLGAGGMGKVYKVRNTISDRVEAMKILLPDLLGQKDLADRFLREIKVLASLSHPNIAGLRTALTMDNQLVMIMEFVDGITISSRLRDGAIPPALAIKYIDQILDALSYAHKQNIIHRDIKPANMMLTPDGTVKLMDFGIARSASDRSLTMTGTTLGSLNYMPPEQVKGDPADNRSDLYSLGVSLYEMVTGQLPFQADSNYAMMAAHLQEAPKPPIVLSPGIPQPLNQIILMALAKDPGQRFQSADAFRGALKSVTGAGEGSAETFVDPRSYVPSASATPGAATSLFQQTPSPAPSTRMADQPAYQQTQPIPAGAASVVPAPPPAARSGNRGLYIALGAFIVVAVLFAAGLYLPSRIKTLAGAGKLDTAKQPSQPAATMSASTLPPTTSGPAPSLGDAAKVPDIATASTDPSAGAQAPQSGQNPPDSSASNSAASPDANASGSNGSNSGGGTPQPAKKPSSKSKKSDSQQASSSDTVPAEVDESLKPEEIERRYDEVDGRAAAVSQSLDNIKRAQAASGYGLRGDIVAAEQHMKTDFSKAQMYMQKQDMKNAKKYLDMGEAELQTIEKFLGH